MSKLTDEQLLKELQERFEANGKALKDLQTLNSKLEKLNKKLQESEALKSHFLSNIRNEINNPLTSIIGLSRQLMGGKTSPEAIPQAASLIHSEAFNLDFQLRNIFIAAELEAGETAPDWSQVDLGCLIQGTIDLFAHRIGEKDIKVTFAPPDEEMPFVSDAQKLQVVLSNLLANAIEFNRAGGEVTIEVSREGETLSISVCDNGIGIAPQDKEKVFDRFWQQEQGSTKSHPGHGLGLSITKALVELLGGTLALASEGGGGCTFVLTFPEKAAPVETETRAQDGNLFFFDTAEQF